jgi:hypothetical protein
VWLVSASACFPLWCLDTETLPGAVSGPDNSRSAGSFACSRIMGERVSALDGGFVSLCWSGLLSGGMDGRNNEEWSQPAAFLAEGVSYWFWTSRRED